MLFIVFKVGKGQLLVNAYGSTLVQHRIAEADFAGFGNSVHHNGKGAVYRNIAACNRLFVMQSGRPFQFRVVIAVALLLMEYFAVKVSPGYIHALDNLDATAISVVNPGYRCCRQHW